MNSENLTASKADGAVEVGSTKSAPSGPPLSIQEVQRSFANKTNDFEVPNEKMKFENINQRKNTIGEGGGGS